MNTLLIITLILVVLFFVKQRECFALGCDACAAKHKKSNCMSLPPSWGCPDERTLSTKLAQSQDWIGRCANANVPCFDPELINEVQKAALDLKKMLDQISDNYGRNKAKLASAMSEVQRNMNVARSFQNKNDGANYKKFILIAANNKKQLNSTYDLMNKQEELSKRIVASLNKLSDLVQQKVTKIPDDISVEIVSINKQGEIISELQQKV